MNGKHGSRTTRRQSLVIGKWIARQGGASTETATAATAAAAVATGCPPAARHGVTFSAKSCQADRLDATSWLFLGGGRRKIVPFGPDCNCSQRHLWEQLDTQRSNSLKKNKEKGKTFCGQGRRLRCVENAHPRWRMVAVVVQSGYPHFREPDAGSHHPHHRRRHHLLQCAHHRRPRHRIRSVVSPFLGAALLVALLI